MTFNKETRLDATITVCSLACFVSGVASRNVIVGATSGACVLLVMSRWLARRLAKSRGPRDPVAKKPKLQKRRRSPIVTPESTGDFVDRMLAQGRYAILLRPEVIGNLDDRQRRMATEMLTNEMVPVTAGEIRMTSSHRADLINGGAAATTNSVGSLFIDRFAVTNEEFAQFIDDGGYENDEFWPQDIRGARQQLVDETGQQGPRFWIDGSYPHGQGNYPVVGISWYEATAYARWAGKRLATGPEWVKAASSPRSETTIRQPKFPWGDEADESRANLWGAGIGKTVAVDEFADRDSQCATQLIGNVWEWNADNFVEWSPIKGWETSAHEIKSIRGGAFDTYFDSQATCQFQSGERREERKHNIGFRCVADRRDLVDIELCT